MAPAPEQPIKSDHSIRNGILAICLIMILVANSVAILFPSVYCVARM